MGGQHNNRYFYHTVKDSIYCLEYNYCICQNLVRTFVSRQQTSHYCRIAVCTSSWSPIFKSIYFKPVSLGSTWFWAQFFGLKQVGLALRIKNESNHQVDIQKGFKFRFNPMTYLINPIWTQPENGWVGPSVSNIGLGWSFRSKFRSGWYGRTTPRTQERTDRRSYYAM